jgi:signal transduction histidine kinase
VWRGEAEIALSAKEFALLETFMRRPGQVLSRFQLLEHAWDYEYENRSNVVDAYVRLLRGKIDPALRSQVDRDRARCRLSAARGRRSVRRVPIRLRVTLAFTAAMALVLVAVGLFVYLRLETELDASVDRDLPAHAGKATASEEESFDKALDNLATLLLVGGPAALLLASLAGYVAAGAALRPVEAMRRRAGEISARRPEERLPVPAANDELRRLGQTLNEMLARIEATLARERRFVDDASHELRTPLALHRAELELALRHGCSEKELRAAIASGLEEVDRLTQLADDLLLLARSEEGSLGIAAEPVRAAELFAAVTRRFEAHASESGRGLTIGEGGNLRVSGDRVRLEQALIGMVDNAFRHGDGDVRLWAIASGEVVELHVGDRGAGFPPEFLSRAFERFSRADAARSRGGSGLGLAIVAAIARAHGGDAGAAHNPAGGADAWIEIPTA